MNFKLCASGDLMLLHKFPENYNYSELADIIKQQDVRLTNIESVVSNWDCHASTFCGGSWVNTEPENIDEFDKYGFNLFSCANNHSMDYSFNGLLSTIKELERRGWYYAGIGRSLKEASAPVYYECENFKGEKIKSALLSVTSTFIDAARAGDARDGIPARPGVNPLRVKTKYLVSNEHFNQLKDIAAATYINGERDNARKIGSLPPEEEGSINFGGHFFVVDAEGKEGKFTYAHDADLNRIINEVKKAKENADYVIVAVHSHQIKRASYTEPDYFLENFAHLCIDAGACAIIGGGTHQLKPIELYKGKPIFYSLGNFVFETGMVKKYPADFWDKYNYPKEWTVKEGLAKKTRNGTIGLECDSSNYLSVIPIMEFEDEKLISLKLLPIELGFNKERALKGLPIKADKNNADRIFNQLNAISSQYGTIFKNGEFITVKLD